MAVAPVGYPAFTHQFIQRNLGAPTRDKAIHPDPQSTALDQWLQRPFSPFDQSVPGAGVMMMSSAVAIISADRNSLSMQCRAWER